MVENTQILFGVMAVLQSLFLPGTLLLKGSNFKGSAIQKLVYTVGLSLVSSYLLGLLLVFLHLYLQAVVVSVFFLQILALIWLYRDSFGASLTESFLHSWKITIQRLQQLIQRWADVDSFAALIRQIASMAAFILSLSLLWWAIKLMNHYTGTIFDLWDTVVSWNQWALSWAEGRMPLNTRNYPQLLPVNYSLTYVFMGSTAIQFFAKFLVLPMALLILLMPLDLGLQTRKGGFFLATVAIYLLLKKFIILELTSGYVDGMMAFFALLVVYTLIKLSLAEEIQEKRQLLILGGVFSGAAAIVKQPGVYIFGLYPLWLYFGLLHQGLFADFWREKKILLTSLGISALLAVPWYVFKQVLFRIGIDRPEVGDLIQISANNNYNVGWARQIFDTISGFEIYLILFPIILLAFFLLKPLYRWLVITLILPYPILWALIASYDTRNLSIFIPIFGLVAGIAIEKLLDWGLSLWDFGKIKLWVLTLIIVIVLAVGLVAKFPNEVLSEKQLALQSQLFSPNKNAMLYDLVEREGTDITIMTNYPMRFLSGFEEVELYDNYKSYAVFLGKLEANEVDYLFVPEYVFVEPQIITFIDEQIAVGNYELVFEDKSWKYYKLLRVIR
mgnify:CR=1 FL=1